MISDVVFCPATNELVSVSKDGTLVFWDLLSGERSRCIDVSAVRPGRCTKLYLADSTYLVVDFDTPDSLAHVYDVITGRLLRACALPRLPSQLRGFVAGRILCRQKCIGDSPYPNVFEHYTVLCIMITCFAFFVVFYTCCFTQQKRMIFKISVFYKLFPKSCF